MKLEEEESGVKKVRRFSIETNTDYNNNNNNNSNNKQFLQ